MSKVIVHSENSVFYYQLLEEVTRNMRLTFDGKNRIEFYTESGHSEVLWITRGSNGILVTDRKDYFVAIEWNGETQLTSTEIFEIYHANDNRGMYH